ncbi:MAG: ribosome-binding factor A [Phycisphaerae bacterium]|nr:ribosome-binding factor A [Phycisphaerae bacterium]
MPFIPCDGAGERDRGARSPRHAQIEALVSRVLRERLARGLNDPRVQGMVSIVGVDLSPDFSSARVRISVLPEDRERLTLSGLRSATRHLESALREGTELRRVPRLSFEIDEAHKRERALYAALDSVRPAAPDDDDASDSLTSPPTSDTPDGGKTPGDSI